MKKKFLAGLATGVFMVGLGGLSYAAPHGSDDVYNDNNPCDWSEFAEYDEQKADINALRDKALRAIPAAGSSQVQDDLYVEGKDCDWSEFESI